MCQSLLPPLGFVRDYHAINGNLRGLVKSVLHVLFNRIRLIHICTPYMDRLSPNELITTIEEN